jgi:hypothetical protein
LAALGEIEEVSHSPFDPGTYARRVPSQEEKNKGKNPMNQRLRKGRSDGDVQGEPRSMAKS